MSEVSSARTGRKQIMFVMGTRPEVIKLAPVIAAIERSRYLEPRVCVTAQHRSLLDQALKFFGLRPDFDLNLMRPNQDLFDTTSGCLTELRELFKKTQPAFVIAQGDTATTFAAALSAFYLRIPVGHIEAGLRTWDRWAPYPEEVYRRMVTELSDLPFAPTPQAAANLQNNRIAADSIYVTGNTAIDALLFALDKKTDFPHLSNLFGGKKLILMTAHRRENFGEPMKNIFSAIREFTERFEGFHVVFPVHPNPNVREIAHQMLSSSPAISLIDPVEYDELAFLMKRAHLILTDSGGIQEEAPTLGKPVLVLRDSTERSEGVEAGCAKLVGTNPEVIYSTLAELASETSPAYRLMSSRPNPFGDGRAADRIRVILEERLSGPVATPNEELFFVPTPSPEIEIETI